MISYLEPLALFPGPPPTVTPSPPSEVPSNVRTTEVTTSNITVLWGSIDSIHDKNSITSYSVRYAIHDSGSSQTVYVPGAVTTQTTISELNSNTTYYIEVAAVNSAGIGTYSNPVNATTKGIHSIYCPFHLRLRIRFASKYS